MEPQKARSLYKFTEVTEQDSDPHVIIVPLKCYALSEQGNPPINEKTNCSKKTEQNFNLDL
jgi:hypothetical protein